jgi:outer membrane protein
LSVRGVYTRNQQEVAAQLPGSTTRLVISPLNQLDAYFQLDVPILDLPNHYRFVAAEHQLDAALEQLQVTEQDVTRLVVRAYYQFAGASALRRSAELNIQVAEANLANVQIKAELGTATELDRERAASAVERARQDLADAELSLKLSARTLETLSGMRPEPMSVSAVDSLAPEAPLAVWEQHAAKAPALQVAATRTKALDATRKASDSVWFPTLTASAQERLTNATGFSGEVSTYTLQAILGWRLDHAMIANNSVAEAQLALSEVQNERLRRAVNDAVFEAYQRVEAGIARCRSARAQQQAAERAAALAAERYSVGAATQLDVTVAQREAFLAQAGSIQADTDLAYARAALRLAAGTFSTNRSNP